MSEVDVSVSQNKLAMEVTEKLTVFDKKVEEHTEAVRNQQKSIINTAKLLRDLMVNIENLGENMKNFQKESEYWRQPKIQDAEMELQDLVKEPQVNPAKVGPSNTPQENPALRPNVSGSVLLDEAQEEDMQRRLQHLRSPLGFSPVSTPLVSLGDPAGSVFTFGSMSLNLIPQTQAMGFNKGIPCPKLDGHCEISSSVYIQHTYQ